MEVALQMSSERWGVQDSPRQVWDVFQVLKGQVYKHQLQYLAGNSGPEPGFSTLWWENHYHFISLIPVPPRKQLPECSTLARQPQPRSLPQSWREMGEKLLKSFWESGNWYLLWEPFSFSPPSQGCNTMAWGFPQRATWGLGGEGTVVPIVPSWQRRFLMKCMRSGMQRQGISWRVLVPVQFCFQKRLLKDLANSKVSSIHAWRNPRTEEPGGLQSMGPQRVRHDWSRLAHTRTHKGSWGQSKSRYTCTQQHPLHVFCHLSDLLGSCCCNKHSAGPRGAHALCTPATLWLHHSSTWDSRSTKPVPPG